MHDLVSIFKRVLYPIYAKLKVFKYRYFGRAKRYGESYKARGRRLREGFFDKYCCGQGLDIGFGGDLVANNCIGYDFEHGDAAFIEKHKPISFDYVYSSHTLEHIVDPESALVNWWQLVKPGGYLILYLPHRDLYEKKRELPSRWNSDHKHFFVLENDDLPHTIGLLSLIKRSLENYEIIYGKECSEGHTITDPLVHSDGEYSLEVVVRKAR